MRHLYLAATGQNRGKTTLSIGVMDGFLRRGLAPGFCKPVGQRTVIEEGVPADEDAVLMKSLFGLNDPLSRMSPVHIPRGFTQAYIDGKVVEDLPARILEAHREFAAERDLLLIEGTGPCWGRRRHRALERGRRIDARRARGHRVRGRGRPADR